MTTRRKFIETIDDEGHLVRLIASTPTELIRTSDEVAEIDGLTTIATESGEPVNTVTGVEFRTVQTSRRLRLVR
jgi:hypothetical protein